MTSEEAIAYGNDYYTDLISACCKIDEKHKEFVRMAIKALEQEPCENNICDSCHTKGCIFQSGIKRVNCEFYTAQNEHCNDAISRESLLNKLCGYHVDIEKSIFDKLWRVIKDMPSVTPQNQVYPLCEDCHAKMDEVRRAYDNAMKQEPVLDKIRAEVENHCGLVKENHCKYCYHCNSVMGVREILLIIDKYKAENEGVKNEQRKADTGI